VVNLGEDKILGEEWMEDGFQVVRSFDRCTFPGIRPSLFHCTCKNSQGK
jgi:hypothetical protein